MVASAETNQFLRHLVVRYRTESMCPSAITVEEMVNSAIIVTNNFFIAFIISVSKALSFRYLTANNICLYIVCKNRHFFHTKNKILKKSHFFCSFLVLIMLKAFPECSLQAFLRKGDSLLKTSRSHGWPPQHRWSNNCDPSSCRGHKVPTTPFRSCTRAILGN